LFPQAVLRQGSRNPLAFFRVVPEKRALLALRHFHFAFGGETVRACSRCPRHDERADRPVRFGEPPVGRSGGGVFLVLLRQTPLPKKCVREKVCVKTCGQDEAVSGENAFCGGVLS
jgi:hypothetical protein